jgi:hypothetical protein
MNQLPARLRSLVMLAAVAAVVLSCEVALGCPTCKDQLAHDPNGANLARGYYYSILFMLSMPPLIFSSLCLYFWYEVRKARARKTVLAQSPSTAALSH